MISSKHDSAPGGRMASMIGLAALGLGLLWACWPTLGEMAQRWSIDPRYSHGFLVPAFALYLLWQRRQSVGFGPARPSLVACWWGVALIALGAALRLAGARFYVNWVEAVGLLPALAGIAVLFGGWPALRWSWPAIAFLLFMIPLPYRLEIALGYPLQHVATLCSTIALQTLGQPAFAEGNIITLNTSRIGVVEACNGLGMLFTFTAMTTGVALIIRRPLADRVLIVLSAVPISFIANVTRITATGFLRETVGGRVASAVYHDLAGWLMMPLALLLLWAEIQLLSRLLVEPKPDGPFLGDRNQGIGVR